MRTYLLASLLLGFCFKLSADAIPALNASQLSASSAPSGFFYSGGGTGFALSGGAGTGPNDIYAANFPINLGFILPGTITSGSQALTVSGSFSFSGSTQTALYFGSATVSPLGSPTFTPSGTAATYAFPAVVQGSFVACGLPGYQLCDTTGQLPANAPALGYVAFNLTGTETLVVNPYSQPNLITYSITFNATSAPEPGSLALILVAGSGLLLFVRFRSKCAASSLRR